MSQGSGASPGLLVKIFNKDIEGLEQVVASYDDAIVFDSDPTAHVKMMRALFELLRKHGFKLSPSKARLDTTDGVFEGNSFLAAGVRLGAKNVE